MARSIALLFSLILVVAGILGMFANPIVGEGAFFQANAWDNVVHLAAGLIFLTVLSHAPYKSGLLLVIAGLIMVIIGIIGWNSSGIILGFMSVNHADNLFHLIAGAIAVIVGLSSRPIVPMVQ